MLLPIPAGGQVSPLPPTGTAVPGWAVWHTGIWGTSLGRMKHLTAHVTACSSALPSDLSKNKWVFFSCQEEGSDIHAALPAEGLPGQGWDAGTNGTSSPHHNPAVMHAQRHSPEPSDPPSARTGMGRKPRGTITTRCPHPPPHPALAGRSRGRGMPCTPVTLVHNSGHAEGSVQRETQREILPAPTGTAGGGKRCLYQTRAGAKLPAVPRGAAHQVVHQPFAALRGDDAQVRLAAVGGELGAVGWRRRGFGRDDLAQSAAVGDGKETGGGTSTHVAVACGRTATR